MSRISRRRLLGGAAGLGVAGAAVAGAAQHASAASTFGLVDDGTNFVVTTGANLVFAVHKTNGDLVSLKYKGTEYQGYTTKNSQVEVGLGASTVTAATHGSVIVVTVVHGTLKHYYVARSGEDNVYMFTYRPDDTVTMQRYIVRLKTAPFPFEGADSWHTDVTAIEASDVLAHADGTTVSKHYSNLRTIDDDYVGKTNGSVGVWLLRSNHERSAGGPFYRSLLRRQTDTEFDLYEIPRYTMAQTEPWRYGLHGPYTLAFTAGSKPSTSLYARNLDTSWIDALGLTGWVGTAGRGRVAGVGIAGMDGSHAYTVGFANTEAQYWASAAASTGRFSCPNMLPGTYTLSVYKGELAVAAQSVTVTAGSTTVLHTLTVTDDPSDDTAIWRLGDFDGTPSGFKNASLMTYAHPSDSRAKAWTGDVVIGAGTAADVPCYVFKDVNSGLKLRFTLTAAQAAAGHTLRIATTANQAGGRPRITVNGWTSAIPAAPSQASTRSLTVGTYRETNTLFTYAVPASAWLKDTTQQNVVTIDVVSGSTSTGWLSPAFSIDAIDLI